MAGWAPQRVMPPRCSLTPTFAHGALDLTAFPHRSPGVGTPFPKAAWQQAVEKVHLRAAPSLPAVLKSAGRPPTFPKSLPSGEPGGS